MDLVIQNIDLSQMDNKEVLKGLLSGSINLRGDLNDFRYDLDLSLEADKRYSFYININCRYGKLNRTLVNQDLTVYPGMGLCDPFDDLKGQSSFLGEIYYGQQSECYSMQAEQVFANQSAWFHFGYCNSG